MKNYQKDYYQILQVHPDAEPEVIQAAYRRLAQKYHPDVNGKSITKMQELNEAYEVLSQPGERAAYDRWYRWRVFAGGQAHSAPADFVPPSISIRWQSLVPALVVMVLLVVFVLDIFQLGVRGAPEITIVLIVMGLLVYYFGGVKDLLE